jgi:hypothetical protein
MMPVKIMRWRKHASMKNYASSLNIVELELRKEMVKWNESFRRRTEESEQCLMMLE